MPALPPQSSTSAAQEDLLQEFERKFAELTADQKLSKLCSDAGFVKEIGKGQFFITIEERSEVMQTACRGYTQPRNLTISRPRGWIRSITKIGPVLDVKLYPHEGRYCIEIMIETEHFHEIPTEQQHSEACGKSQAKTSSCQ